MKSNFLRQIEFDHWANGRFLTFLEGNEMKEEKVFSIFGHILSAQVLWLRRITPVDAEEYPLWKVYPTKVIGEMNDKSYHAWKKFIEDHSDDNFSEVISYNNTKGQAFQTPLKEIIEHVLYHGVYHRGQLAMLIRQSGLTPPYTDFIAFVREQ